MSWLADLRAWVARLTGQSAKPDETEGDPMSDSAELMKKAAESGAAFISQQQAKTKADLDAEAARQAGLPDDQLPEGVYATKDEAEAYLNQQRAKGRYPLPIDDGTGNGDFAIKVSSPYKGFQEVWITAVADENPNPGSNVPQNP
jgi:hypothetical protein